MHDLIIFDCDGVLVDSEPLSNQILVDNLAGYGLILSVEDSVGFFLGGTMAGVHARARQMGADLPDDWGRRDLCGHLRRIARRRCSDARHSRPFIGAGGRGRAVLRRLEWQPGKDADHPGSETDCGSGFAM